MSRLPVVRAPRLAAVAVCAVLVCTGCTSSAKSTAVTPPTTTTPPAAATSGAHPAKSAGSPAPSASTTVPSPPPPSPASVHANELGRVPVLMYHKLVAHPTSDYERRPADFVADLTWLDKHGFVPVTAANFVAGKIDIPAGKHPVVFTFDDGTETQFVLGADGKPVPGTALALMQTFAATHPEFPAIATFYVNQAPFGTQAGEKALAYLTAHGCEVGVHTVHHYSLGTLTDAKVQAEIAQNLTMINTADPAQKVTTMALPFGVRPKEHDLAQTGSSGGVSYHLAAVMAVGAGPSHSPYNASFDPSYVPRIRAENVADAKPADRPYISGTLLPQLAADAADLYTSDGDPAHVSFPKTSKVSLGAQWKAMAQPY